MFSFHKPRVYRSSEGCCICRAKSSSSRFTDSRKYEDDSMKCFNLDKPRQGEICNACVLLVKRFKRLPIGSNRHWGHVVDARVGPGMKSMTKFKKLREECERNDGKGQKANSSIPEKFSKIFKKTKKHSYKNGLTVVREGTPGLWDPDDQSLSPTPESFHSDFEDIHYPKTRKRNRRKLCKPKKNIMGLKSVSFIDENIWKFRKICCGYAYENSQINAIIIDLENFQPCSEHNYSVLQKVSILQNSNRTEKKSHLVSMIKNNLKSENSIQLPALKKHHLFLKRQNENYLQNDMVLGNNLKIENKTIVAPITVEKNEDVSTKNKLSILHKLKSDTGKIVKHSLSKINFRLTNDVKEIKNLVDNSISSKKIEVNKLLLFQNKKILDPTATKFSDNSSDSGFDENLLDRKSGSPITEDVQLQKKQLNHTVQKMYLSSGIHTQGQHQNLVLTGNELATKVFQRKQHPQMNTKY